MIDIENLINSNRDVEMCRVESGLLLSPHPKIPSYSPSLGKIQFREIADTERRIRNYFQPNQTRGFAIGHMLHFLCPPWLLSIRG